MGRVASFDVFDTVLTRLGGDPRQVFVAAGQQLRQAGVIATDAEAYAAAREQAARDLTPDLGVHPTLGAIAGEVASRLGLPEWTGDALAAAELEVEREVCRAVPGAVARATERRRDTGRGLVFVSDTPLPSTFLEDLLVREGLFRPGDRLFTSAECGASKQEGGLFDVVAAALGVSPETITHVGDDRWSDVANARLHGWSAVLDVRASFTLRERTLDDQTASTSGLGPRLAAASRLGRLQSLDSGIDGSIAAIAGAVATPLLVGFGLWVLQQASLMDLDRLYFVARDGEVFLEVTRQLAHVDRHQVDCRYLYGSRRSWQLASNGVSGLDGRDGLWLPDEASAEALSAREVLSLVDLVPTDAYAITRTSLFETDRVDHPLGTDGWARLQTLIKADLASEIDRRSRDRRQLLLRYLDQEGVTADGRVGLVDVGWTGRAARSLEDVLEDGDRPLPAAHLFLGLLATAPALMGEDLFGRSHGWLLDEARGRRSHALHEDPVMVVESFAMGHEGHTIGYAVDGQHVVPQLTAPRNPASERWQFDGFRRALANSVEAFTDGPAPPTGVDLRSLVWRQLLDFWRRPERAEAAAWGQQPYGEDFHNALSHPLAAAVTGRRLMKRLGVGRSSWREPTYWRAGSIALSSQPWRSLLAAATQAQRLRDRLPAVPLRLRRERALRRPASRS